MIQIGQAWIFGDSVPNDGGIMPIDMVREKVYDKEVLANYCMSQIDSTFAKKVHENDFIIAGTGFGVGQLHVQGPLSIIGLRLGVLSESMTRPFFRISASLGLHMLPFAKNIRKLVKNGDRLEVNYRTGEVKNLTTGDTAVYKPLPDFLNDIIDAGGEMNWLKMLKTRQGTDFEKSLR